jgi:hypothetical protein
MRCDFRNRLFFGYSKLRCFMGRRFNRQHDVFGLHDGDIMQRRKYGRRDNCAASHDLHGTKVVEMEKMIFRILIVFR